MEIVLFIGLLLHIFQGLYLVFENKKAGPVAYAVTNGNANSKWYSRIDGIIRHLAVNIFNHSLKALLGSKWVSR